MAITIANAGSALADMEQVYCVDQVILNWHPAYEMQTMDAVEQLNAVRPIDL